MPDLKKHTRQVFVNEVKERLLYKEIDEKGMQDIVSMADSSCIDEKFSLKKCSFRVDSIMINGNDDIVLKFVSIKTEVHNEVFITNNNARNLVISMDKEDIDITEQIYKAEFKWFSKVEIRSLLTYKLFYENPDLFLEKYKKKIEAKNNDFGFSDGKAAFHATLKCELLNSNYLNIVIPEEIKLKGEDEVLKFRRYLKQNSHLLESKQDLLEQKIKVKFNIIEDIKFVDYSNSGATAFQNNKLDNLEQEIDSLIDQANEFYNGTLSNTTILDIFGTLSFLGKKRLVPYKNPTSYTNEEIWSVLSTFDSKFKRPLERNLINYYRVANNPELKFSKEILINLNFKPCSACC